ncbi:glutamate racemase [Halioxenophilus aromaticivorans]|uniref:Glutamate racemase n=1 Tax=Halioxenophilus aromaticivorans TaxID=1306992 RepID=A0AAV3UAA0_9ALTE
MQSFTQDYSNPNLPNVLVFDSGVGGLTITREIVALTPNCNITFAADNAYFPYGTKSEQDLVARICHVLQHLVQITAADLVIIACNSASTAALPALRDQLAIPVVGVVPAIKPAAAISASKTIGLLATPGTVARDYTDDLIKQFAPDCHVIKIGSRRLVDMAEAKLAGGTVHADELANELERFAQPDHKTMDTVVLACTHFPLLQPELSQCLPGVAHWIDSGNAIARRAESLLLPIYQNKRHSIATNSSAPTYRCLFTQEPRNPMFLIEYLSSWFTKNWSVVIL